MGDSRRDDDGRSAARRRSARRDQRPTASIRRLRHALDRFCEEEALIRSWRELEAAIFR